MNMNHYFHWVSALQDKSIHHLHLENMIGKCRTSIAKGCLLQQFLVSLKFLFSFSSNKIIQWPLFVNKITNFGFFHKHLLSICQSWTITDSEVGIYLYDNMFTKIQCHCYRQWDKAVIWSCKRGQKEKQKSITICTSGLEKTNYGSECRLPSFNLVLNA